MAARLQKLQSLNQLSSDLRLNGVNHAKLLLSSYLPRLRDRFSAVPTPVFHLTFRHENRTVQYNMRSNDIDWLFLAALFRNGEYGLPGTARPKRILDLGGNIGSADIVFHCAYPDAEFIAVEPVPANVAILRKNWADNGIKGRIVEAAATGEPGTRTFFLGNPDCSSLLNRDDLTGGSIKVNCVTVPQLLDDAGWDSVDLMKIDIEGGEIEVFKSSESWAHRVDMMIGELHNGYSVADADHDLNGQFEFTQTFEYPRSKMVGFVATQKRILPEPATLTP